MAIHADKDLLDLAVSELEGEGYQVVREPGKSILPKELKNFRPDALAIGANEKLLVVISSEGSQRKSPQNLDDFLKENPTWKVKVFQFRSTKRTLPKSEEKLITEEYFRFRDLVAHSNFMPALLVGWACLEASARLLDVERFAWPQTPMRVLQKLAENGEISPDVADEIRSVVELRNRYVHGDFSASISSIQLEALNEAILELHPQIKRQRLFRS